MGRLYELKEKLATVGSQLKNIDEQLLDKVSNPSVPMAEVTALKEKRAELQERFDVIKEAHDKAEAEQRDLINRQNPTAAASDQKERLIAAKAEFFRATIQQRTMSKDAQEVFDQLQAIPAPTATGGENFLPTTLSNELIAEPFTKNPLRGVISMSNIKGLELPRIAYKIDDDDFIGDDETAQELELEGDKVSFGRFKFKVFAAISDTVLHGSDVELVSYVENALRSGLAAKEKKVAFAGTPSLGEEHMSFYQEDGGETVIKTVEGADLYEAITNAIADLHEDFRENAKVCMRYADYVTILKTLANGNATLFNAPPEQIIGKPVIFCDAAATPIIGDFNYAHLNYDGVPIYDTDKDVKSGDYLFVITAWIDMQFKLKSAFRLTAVVPEEL